jgi:hypothetical protein
MDPAGCNSHVNIRPEERRDSRILLNTYNFHVLLTQVLASPTSRSRP